MKKLLMAFLCVFSAFFLLNPAKSAQAERLPLFEQLISADDDAYFAYQTGYAYEDTVYYLMRDSIYKRSRSMLEKYQSPVEYVEGVRDMTICGNLMLYVTTENKLHVADLDDYTDKIIKKGIESIARFDGVTIAVRLKNTSEIVFLDIKGNTVPDVDWDFSEDKLEENYYKLRDDLYYLDLQKKGESTLYKIEDSGRTKIGSADLRYVFSADSYEIYSLDRYLVVKTIKGKKENITIYNFKFKSVYKRSFKYKDKHYELNILDDYLYELLMDAKTYEERGHWISDYFVVLNLDVYNVDIDTLTFGTGKDGQPLKWIILEKKKDKMLLMYDGIINTSKFGKEVSQGTILWKKSTIRKWLNGDFYSNYFSDDEKSKIITTTVKNCDCFPREGDSYYVKQKSTKDNIFLLSFDEVLKYRKELIFNEDSFWLRNGYGGGFQGKVCCFMGAETYDFCTGGYYNEYEWIVSPKMEYGVKPVMWVKISD